MNRRPRAGGIAAALVLAGCTAAPPMPAPPPTHPASPHAAEAPLPAGSDTLRVPGPPNAPSAPEAR